MNSKNNFIWIEHPFYGRAFGESDADVQKWFEERFDEGFIPVICPSAHKQWLFRRNRTIDE